MKPQFRRLSAQFLTFISMVGGFLASLPDLALAGLLEASALTTSTARLGTTTQVYISAGSPTSFLLIGNIHDFKAMQGTNSEVEVTNMTSTAKEFLLDLADNGEATFSLDTDFGDVGQAVAVAAKETNPPTKCDFKIVLPTGMTTPTMTFQGYVKQFDIGGGVGAAIKSTLTIRVTGAVTRA